jgi:hypothetical protein
MFRHSLEAQGSACVGQTHSDGDQACCHASIVLGNGPGGGGSHSRLAFTSRPGVLLQLEAGRSGSFIHRFEVVVRARDLAHLFGEVQFEGTPCLPL